MPSFVGGVSAVVSFDEDVFDDLHTSHTEAEADHNAIAADWQAVGADLRSAMSEYDQRA